MRAPGVPAGRSLRPYQIEGAAHLIKHPHVLLADEQGLGKTIQVAAAINAAREGVKVFIGCPETLMFNWMRELHSWLTVRRSIGLATAKNVPDTEIVIANYDIFPRLTGHFRGTAYHIAVLDEAHRIKTPSAQRTQAACLISAGVRWALTGTPIQNAPIELWSILRWLMGDRVADYGLYARQYCAAHLRTVHYKRHGKPLVKKVWDMSGATNLDQLHTYLTTEAHLLRRLKADVLTDLPAKTRQIIELRTTPMVERLLRKEAVAAREFGGYDAAIRALRAGGKIAFEDWTEARHELAMQKIDPALEFLADVMATDEKVVVFCHHRDVAAGLALGMKKYGVAMVLGGSGAAHKDTEVRRFQTDPTCRVFIGNDAASEGLTLTAAQRCVFVELDPVPGVMNQKEDRLHRIGQRGNVLVQALVFDNSLDVRLLKILWSKDQMIGRAVEGGRM